MTSRTKKVAVCIGAPIVLMGVFVAFGFKRPLNEQAVRAVDCFAAKDADCLASYIRPEELSSLGMTPASYKRLLHEYVFDDIATVGNQRAFTKTGVEGLTEVWFEAKMKSGSTQAYCFEVANTDDGVRIPKAAFWLLHPISRDKYYTVVSPKSGVNTIATWIKWAKNDGPMLQAKYGLKGMQQTSDGQLLPWADWEQSLRARLSKSEQEKLADSGL